MTGPLDTLAGALLWSRLGAAELVLALIVGLVLLAFALPAHLHGGEPERGDARDPRPAGPRRG